MNMSKCQKVSLGLAGFTALAIGLFILIEPYTFYAGYGITLPPDPGLLSELRAAAANLAALGAIMLTGLFYPLFARISLVMAITVFTAFPLGRIIAIALDGVPPQGILAALIIEIVIGALLVWAFARKHKPFPARH